LDNLNANLEKEKKIKNNQKEFDLLLLYLMKKAIDSNKTMLQKH
jgi:hypothetical protein